MHSIEELENPIGARAQQRWNEGTLGISKEHATCTSEHTLLNEHSLLSITPKITEITQSFFFALYHDTKNLLLMLLVPHPSIQFALTQRTMARLLLCPSNSNFIKNNIIQNLIPNKSYFNIKIIPLKIQFRKIIMYVIKLLIGMFFWLWKLKTKTI